ncbi:hypothetical protein J2Z70_003164 [Paenibacillus silagei]|uniref:Transposase n=1 Tax=Paenibacillus silagei TaxID=1670801 RepID=A0ABS4NSJ0_9BACL|nr:hypothetical protein [Paenibacillus silagei]
MYVKNSIHCVREPEGRSDKQKVTVKGNRWIFPIVCGRQPSPQLEKGAAVIETLADVW